MTFGPYKNTAFLTPSESTTNEDSDDLREQTRQDVPEVTSARTACGAVAMSWRYCPRASRAISGSGSPNSCMRR